MTAENITAAKKAAIEVLLHNLHGPYRRLPRTAGWGYPEPYTRDLMIASLGMLLSQEQKLISAVRKVLTVLALNQTERGHIPSLVHDPGNRGASDTTPLFILALGFYRIVSGENDFLEDAVRRAMRWMNYQSPYDSVMVAQMPTTDWRDEQWVMGFGLFVNAVIYGYLRLYGELEKAQTLKSVMSGLTITAGKRHKHVHDGLRLAQKPYFALWSFKSYGSERFDLLGNSLAILTGLASPARAAKIIAWVETECRILRANGDLALTLPPNLFPYIRPEDPDWLPRYERYNRPGMYHNGGIWPFICGFYIAAAVAAGKMRIAEKNLEALAEAVKMADNPELVFGFNEYLSAQDGHPRGQDWQTWSAAMFIYAAECVERGQTPFFDKIRAAA
jgi:hypothetical protein